MSRVPCPYDGFASARALDARSESPASQQGPILGIGYSVDGHRPDPHTRVIRALDQYGPPAARRALDWPGGYPFGEGDTARKAVAVAHKTK